MSACDTNEKELAEHTIYLLSMFFGLFACSWQSRLQTTKDHPLGLSAQLAHLKSCRVQCALAQHAQCHWE
jgi:hypothetical protein